MKIIIDNLESPDVHNLLREHLAQMAAQSPPESIHALDLSALKQPDITFWTAWDDTQQTSSSALMGCGALKELSATHGEIKSMRTATPFLRRGVAAAMLSHILDEAKQRGYQQLSLETGSMQSFRPAQQLYKQFGFTECEPFANYLPDPNSIFMTRRL